MKKGRPSARREVANVDDAAAAKTLDRAKGALGTLSNDFAVAEYARLGVAIMRHDLPEDSATAINTQLTKAALAAVEGLCPKDEVEAMLAVQMVATHVLGMRMMERAAASKNWGESELACNFANKLMRTFAAQTEALAKLRRGGEQTVRVEHVNVLPGGQAVVGNVTHQTITGGRDGKNGGQAHATEDARALVFTTSSPMRSQDPEGTTVPITRSERQRPVSNARWRKR